MEEYAKAIEELNTILEGFYRRVSQEKKRFQNAFGFHFDTEENRRFADEIDLLRPVERVFCRMYDSFRQSNEVIRLEMFLKESIGIAPVDWEVTAFSNLEKEQILWYLFRKQAIIEESGKASDLFAYEIYLLELANLTGGLRPEEALDRIFSVFYSGKNAGLDQNLFEDYFLRICQSFLIANPSLSKKMQEYLSERDLLWKWDLSGTILAGDYQHAAEFVKRHAKGMKEEELAEKKEFQKAAWTALPNVMASLDQTFSTKEKRIFEKILTIGKESKMDVQMLPVCRSRMGQKRRVILSDTASFDYKMNYGKQSKESWLLSQAEFLDGGKEFLTIIYRYTESFMREAYGVTKRKRTVASFLKKKYARSGEHQRVIIAMKEILKDPRFEEAILAGVKEYGKKHPIVKTSALKKENAKERAKRLLYAMDHEEVERKEHVDLEIVRKLRQEANHMMSLFQDGTIDYK